MRRMSGPVPAPIPALASRWSPRVVAPRLPGLVVGLALFGVGVALMARSGLGLGPWEVLHQGLAKIVGLQLGTVSILVGIPVLAAWWPLGERPGVGTILNIALLGLATNVTLGIVSPATDLGPQLGLLLAGVGLIAVGSAFYLSADLGPGPRDGLMTGLHMRFGWTIRRTRTAIEVTVVLVGFLAGGTVGIGTVLFAVCIGPLVQLLLPVVDREGRLPARRRALLEARGLITE